MGRVVSVVGAVLLLFCSRITSAQDLSPLYRFHDSSLYATSLSVSKSRRYTLSRLNVHALQRPHFAILSPDGRAFFAQRTKQSSTRFGLLEREHGSARSETISGILKERRHGSKAGEFTIAITNGPRESRSAVYGAFLLFHEPTSLVVTADRSRRRFRLDEVMEDLQPSCAGNVSPAALLTRPPLYGVTKTLSGAVQTHRAAQASSDTVIDVAILYSSQALASVGGTSNLLSEANVAIASANQAYQNSLIPIQLRLVYAGPSVSSESGNVDTDLGRLASTGDGYFDEAASIISAYGADVVSLFVQSASYCGVAFVSARYSVVLRSCISNLSFQHEVGHNMGAMHDLANSGGVGAYSYSYGWRFTGSDSTQYRTVMAYAPGIRINYFSNPNVNYMGVPTGTDTANNALTLTNTRATVAAWSATVTPPTTSTTTSTTSSSTSTSTSRTTSSTSSTTSSSRTTSSSTSTSSTSSSTSSSRTSTSTSSSSTSSSSTSSSSSSTSSSSSSSTSSSTTSSSSTSTTLPPADSDVPTPTPTPVATPTPNSGSCELVLRSRATGSLFVVTGVLRERASGVCVRNTKVRIEYRRSRSQSYYLVATRGVVAKRFRFSTRLKGSYRFVVRGAVPVVGHLVVS